MTYVRRLEVMLIDVVSAYGIAGRQIEGPVGRVGRAGRSWNKIAAIGVRVEKGVAMHGFALNCNNSMDPYREIIACGISRRAASRRSRETGRDVTPNEIAPAVARAFDRAFEEVPA